MIFKVLSEEEDKFNRTIDQGLAILGEMEEEMVKNGETTLSGENAFKLYDLSLIHIYNFDMTILLIEHDMKLVSGICEKLTVLNFGQVLTQGDTADVLNDPEVIKAYLGE